MAEAKNRIYMMVAPTGSFAPQSNDPNGGWVLTLQAPVASTFWYTDRPDRDSGESAIKDYIDNIWPDAYGQTPPNATVQFTSPDSDRVDGLYVTLSEPEYDPNGNVVKFRAQLLNSTFDAELPDSLSLTKVSVNVLNNVTDDKEVSSYVQYAEQASLMAGAAGLELVLADTADEMFWVDNAPGMYSDSRPISDFLAQWSYVFADDPPNAALLGTTPSAGLRVHFLTLEQPTLDAQTGELRYAVKLLGEDNHGSFEILSQAVLLIDSGRFSRFPLPGKGSAYQAFGAGYDPSTANNTYIYFGSDIARREVGSLWGKRSNLTQSCDPYCRDDLQKMKDMGINLIRLYDWDPRNDHSQFLNYAHQLGIKVVVPISNWLPKQGPDVWDEQIPDYLKYENFGNEGETDWHPAVAGVIVSNELDREDGGIYYSNAIGLVAHMIQAIDKKGYSKSVPVGIPVTFTQDNSIPGSLPAWHSFDRFVNDPRLAGMKDRLMLCPNTYNSGPELYKNFAGLNQGWVPLTYARYGVPILFTEIGQTRSGNSNVAAYVKEQLTRSLEYQKANPDQLLGVAHFQFDDKVWKQTPNDTDTEGAFGMYHHGQILKQIQTVQQDYSYYNSEAKGGYGVLTIDELVPTSLLNAVMEAYR